MSELAKDCMTVKSTCLIVSNGIERGPTIATKIPVHSHVDPTISWHRKPHVVRVSVDGILIIGINVEILFKMLITPVLCKNLAVGSVSLSTTHSSINEHIFCCRWNYIWDDK